MSLVAHAVLFTVFVWWFTTGIIIYLDGLPRPTFAISMTVATVLLLAAFQGMASASADTSIAGAYWAFAFALMAWGWNEMGFLMGIITGPRDTPSPQGARGFERLAYATQTVLYHEVAIAGTAFGIYAATEGAANQVALQTFALLWVMRLSAKLNVYLGVPNITEEFLPPHLKYLQTYFRKRPMNALFPVSITLGTLLSAYLVMQARLPEASAFEVTANTLLATLSILAVVEHWFMVLPIPATALWQWGLKSHAAHAVGVLVPHPTAAAEPAEVPALPSSIVPFPTPTPATHRRRP